MSDHYEVLLKTDLWGLAGLLVAQRKGHIDITDADGGPIAVYGVEPAVIGDNHIAAIGDTDLKSISEQVCRVLEIPAEYQRSPDDWSWPERYEALGLAAGHLTWADEWMPFLADDYIRDCIAADPHLRGLFASQ